MFGICGKTIESLRRNVIVQLPTWLEALSRSGSAGTKISSLFRGGRTNSFYLFGGRDESSYTLIQGITLAGCCLTRLLLCPAPLWSRLWRVVVWTQ